MFSDLLDRKLVILCYKNIDLKKPKVLHFFKVVSSWFLVKKWKFCPFFFLSEIGQKKVFCGLLDSTVAISGYKNIVLKTRVCCIISKGVHGFGQKLKILIFFLFQQNR